MLCFHLLRCCLSRQNYFLDKRENPLFSETGFPLDCLRFDGFGFGFDFGGVIVYAPDLNHVF